MLFTFSDLFAEAVWAALELEILVQGWELFPVFCGAGNFLCPTPGCWGLPVATALCSATGPPHWCGGWGKTCVGAVWDFCAAGVLQLGWCLPPVCFLACSFVYIKPSWKGAVLSSRASKRNINIYIQVERNVGMYWGLNPPGFCSAALLCWGKRHLWREKTSPVPPHPSAPRERLLAPSLLHPQPMQHTLRFSNPVWCQSWHLNPTDLVWIQHQSFLFCFYHHFSKN